MAAVHIARRARSCRRWAPPVALLLAVLLLLVLGCERRAQEAPATDAPAATLRITADHGRELLLKTRVAPDQSLMRALRATTPVRTEYGGGFVAEMFARSSDPGAQRDWFVFANGLLAPVGARDIRLRDGDAIWWDFRDWGPLMDPWAVVGSWPAPFTRPAPAVFADPPLAAALSAAGATLSDDPTAPWRVRVGAHRDLIAADPGWRRAAADPGAAGLTVRVEEHGIAALTGEEWQPVAGARAAIVAVPTGDLPERGVLLAVVGLDAAAARAAADALATDPSLVRDSYALVLDGAGRPLAAGGRPTGG